MELKIEEKRLANISSNQIREILSDRDPELVERFIQYNRSNKDILDLFIKNSLTMYHVGYKNYSAKAIAEKIRWDKDLSRAFSKDPGAEFKLNNNYTACYARVVMAKVPQLEGFFNLRKKG